MTNGHEQEEASVSRRELLVAAGALASVAGAGAAAAASHHDDATHAAAGAHDHAAHAPRRPDLLRAVEACSSTGRRCVSHCLVTFREGDTSLADCAAAVHEMVAVCAAMETLLASNSSQVPGLAKVCLDTCETCAAECEKHAAKHQECRECQEACEALIPKLRQIAA